MDAVQAKLWDHFHSFKVQEAERKAHRALRDDGGPAGRMWADQVTYRVLRQYSSKTKVTELMLIRRPGFPDDLWFVERRPDQSARFGSWSFAARDAHGADLDRLVQRYRRCISRNHNLINGAFTWEQVKWDV